jgi:hypothetical protein
LCDWDPSWGKKQHTVTFTDAWRTFVKTPEWMLSQWVGEWRVSAVGAATWKTKTRSGRPCTDVAPRNEERRDQLIRANRRIATRELCTELFGNVTETWYWYISYIC